MIINAEALKGIFTGYKTAFHAGFEGAQTAYKTICMTVPSTTREETYGWLGQFPKMREWIGDRVIKNLALHGYKIVNRDFEQTISVGRNDIEDDQYGVFTPMFAEMGRSAAELPDELTFSLLKAGFTVQCYDGQAFFDTDHPVGNGEGPTVSVSNTGGGSGEPWILLDCSKMIKPMVFQERRPLGNLVTKDDPRDENVFNRKEYIYGSDGRCNVGFGLWQLAYASKQPLTAENYEAARKQMQTLKGDEGRPLGIKPTHLLCGPELEGAAMRLLNNGSRIVMADDGDGGEVPLALENEWKGTATPIVTPWLA